MHVEPADTRKVRTIWNGVIDFGTSQIPVGLAATRESGDIEFRTLHRECLKPIKQTRSCEEHGKVGTGETVKGWEVAPGEFIAIEDVDLEQATPLGASRRIELLGVTPFDEISPLAFDRPYFLVPSSSRFGHTAYAAFAGAVHRADSAVICRFYAWGKEQLAAITPIDEQALLLQTLQWAEDIRDHDVDELLVEVVVKPAERKAADVALSKIRGRADLAALRSTHRDAVKKMLEERLNAAKRRSKRPKRRSAVGSSART